MLVDKYTNGVSRRVTVTRTRATAYLDDKYCMSVPKQLKSLMVA